MEVSVRSKVWRIMHPLNEMFATLTVTGKWDSISLERDLDGREDGVCAYFNKNPRNVGDFTNLQLGYGVCATEETEAELRLKLSGWTKLPVCVVQAPKGLGERKPETILHGRKLCLIWATRWVSALSASSFATELNSSRKGADSVFNGVARIEYEWDKLTKSLYVKKSSRVPGKGMLVSARDLAGADVFRESHVPGCMLCTDTFKGHVEKMKYSNVEFMEWGDVIE